jgi:tetratricopeptide (TPR) repeat protein
LVTVQSYVRDIFNDFQPSVFHKKIPLFAWAAIATTNYDLIIERAYDQTAERVQQLVPFRKDGERVEDRLRAGDVPFLKLHGCISDVHDEAVRLILTPDQYVTHRRGRKRLFARLADYATEYPVVFAGHSLEDVDLRAVLLELDELEAAKPRSYLVVPNLTPADRRYWEARRITCIDASFSDFMSSLDAAVPQAGRPLALRTAGDLPIAKHLRLKPADVLSDSLEALLERDVEYIHSDIATAHVQPAAFYKGYFTDWGPIVANLDVKRAFADDILSEVILADDAERPSQQELILVKGSAGAGKTVALRRIAWEAAVSYDKLCLVSRATFSADYEGIYELYRLAGKRIFLFIDAIADHVDTLERVLQHAQRDRVPITIVATERFTDWNTQCERLERYVTASYDVPYLSEREIRELLQLLTRHDSLGHLKNKTIEQQVEDLSKRAGRQLLVALHEATFGKPFEEIVLSEYNRIATANAKSLYLTVCVLHRLGLPTRAGLISRVHQIPFHLFRDELFKPLEAVVFATQRSFTQDVVYESRHPHVAEIVFESVLTDVNARFDEMARIVNGLDVDYRTDQDALAGIMNARRLEALFPDVNQSRQLFRLASRISPDDAILMQQESILEMRSGSGSLERAGALLETAHRLMPRNLAITHSLSELALRSSERAGNDLERGRFRQKARELINQILKVDPDFGHPYHTVLKIELQELQEDFERGDADLIAQRVNAIERILDVAMQRLGDQEFLLEAESRLHALLNNFPASVRALERAFEANRRSPFIALRLARWYDGEGKREAAIRTLRECLEGNPSDKAVNFRLAMLLMGRSSLDDHADIKHCLRKAFTRGDNRYAAQFWYARLLFLEGDYAGASELFDELAEARVSAPVKRDIKGKVLEGHVASRFSGTVIRREASYALIKSDRHSKTIFAPGGATDVGMWTRLSAHVRVTFELAFNYRGPVAQSIKLERDSLRVDSRGGRMANVPHDTGKAHIGAPTATEVR